MKIVYHDPTSAFRLNERAYEAFLQALHIPQAKVDLLHVVFTERVTVATAEKWYGGCFNYPIWTIEVATRRKSGAVRKTARMNRTLLHETRHYQQYCERGYCYAPGEATLPHSERPAEIDAIQFANDHQTRNFAQISPVVTTLEPFL